MKPDRREMFWRRNYVSDMIEGAAYGLAQHAPNDDPEWTKYSCQIFAIVREAIEALQYLERKPS